MTSSSGSARNSACCYRASGLKRVIRLLALVSLFLSQNSLAKGEPRFVDLSLLIDPAYPITWPQNFPFFQINPFLRIGAWSSYNSDILTIDGNTGTQVDFPPHSIPAPNTKLPNAGPLVLA